MVIIEGVAFPLDKLNKNGWGVPASEADNAISSLKNAVIRVCPRDSPHGCDYSEDPKAEIGRVLDAWKEGQEIKARADITDSVASQKIQEGTWPKKWSVYSKASSLKDGWVSGINARSLTLVTNPAWGNASWEVVAADGESLGIHSLNVFSIQAVDDIMTEALETPAGGETSTELAEQLALKQKEIDGLKQMVASLEGEVSKRMPVEEVQKLVASEGQKIAAAEIEKYKAETAKTAAFEKLVAARKDLGLETKAEDYQTLTAADVEKMADEFSKIKLSAGSHVTYPSNPGSGTVGRWDPTKKEWVI
jgi:hypothetical protein